MDSADVKIGRNVIQLRGSRSQKDLAAEMTSQGWKWAQATVWAVEQGTRPLRLAEAETLANIFDVNVADLLGTDKSALSRHIHQAVTARAELEERVAEYEQAREDLAWMADQTAPSNSREAEIVSTVARTNAGQVVSEALQAHWKRRAAEDVQAREEEPDEYDDGPASGFAALYAGSKEQN
jgi:predicted transcriptional regulator